MPKPLFRWTIGPALQQGLDVLLESLDRTTETLGLDQWDWAVCYNGLNRPQLDSIKERIGTRPIRLIAQDWANCPIPDNCQTPRRPDGSFIFDGKICGGSLWKVCPPRLRLDAHEIIMDNDVVLLKKFPQIDEFLASNKTLILEEPIKFYGRYDCLFSGDRFLNSGFMGMPPNYDFGKEIYKVWSEYGAYQNLTQADEQGLLTLTLSKHPNIRISKEQMKEVLNRDFGEAINGNEEGIHFTQVNRMLNHRAWNHYKKLRGING